MTSAGAPPTGGALGSAVVSPLAIVLFGAGTAVGILVGLPIAAAALLGVAAWGARVLAALPRGGRGDRGQPGSLPDPWRSSVMATRDAKTRFDRAVREMPAGTARTQLSDVAARLDQAVAESWRIARRGNEISTTLGRLDTLQAQTDLARVRAQVAARPDKTPTDDDARALHTLEAQLRSAEHLQNLVSEARERLDGLEARIDGLAARATHSGAGADTTSMGADADAIVRELESLRVTLDGTTHAEHAAPPAAT